MNDEQKKSYLDRYTQAKQKGVKFWPDIIYKDLLISFAVFLVLVLLATFVGVAAEPKADPSDSSYIPRPEWYFLWLFEFLKYIPGELEWIGATVIPGVLVALLFLLPFIDRNPGRFWKKRPVAITVMTLIVLAIIGLTISAAATTPPQEEAAVIGGTIPEKMAAGEELYSIFCTECHGPDGDVRMIEGVEGLEGAFVSPISSKDVIYTRTDETLRSIIEQGQQELGMPPFGKAYGGELSPGEIEAIVTFMRYAWDDRVEVPEDAAPAGKIPELAEGETPTWDKHIAPLFKRYCASCHRPGKENGDYLVQSYAEAIESGVNAPVMVAGDANSLLLRLIYREDIPNIAGPMPPSKPLPENLVKMIELWVLAGMPENESNLEGASPTEGAPAPEEPPTPTPSPEISPTPQENTPTGVAPASATATPTFTAAAPTATITPLPDGFTPSPNPDAGVTNTPYP
jgi:mono/diheme cytochrome c family protein